METKERIVFKTHGCGRSFTREEWDALPHAFDFPTEDETGKYLLESRHCPCKSTLGIEYKIMPDGTKVLHNVG